MEGLDPALISEDDAVGIDPYAQPSAYVPDNGAWASSAATPGHDASIGGHYHGGYFVDPAVGYDQQYATAGPSNAAYVPPMPAYSPYANLNASAAYPNGVNHTPVVAPTADYWYPPEVPAAPIVPDAAPLLEPNQAFSRSPERQPRSVSISASASDPPRKKARGPVPGVRRGPYKVTRERLERERRMAEALSQSPAAAAAKAAPVAEPEPEPEPEYEQIMVTPRKVVELPGAVEREEECPLCHGTETSNKDNKPESLISCGTCGRSGERGKA